jgi:hypothetical protein
MLCQPGATCLLDCTGAIDCSHIDCDPGANCQVICGDSEACAFSECEQGQMSCPGTDNMIACGSCP